MKMKQNQHFVFVYGTLRKHERNHGLLSSSGCIASQCWITGRLVDTGYGFPAVLLDEGGRVYGELYKVSESTLEQLDRLEGYSGPGKSNHYERAQMEVRTDVSTETAFVYYYKQNEGYEWIESGDWKCHNLLERSEQLYFAYGSCMDNRRFMEHGVGHLFTDVVGCGIAQDFSLGYTKKSFDGGRADIVEIKGDVIEGKVYRVSEDSYDYLFDREGVGYGTYRPTFIDVQINGVIHENVLTFVVVNKKKEIAPPVHYAHEILRGAKGCVSETYFQKLQADLYDKFVMIVSIDNEKEMV